MLEEVAFLLDSLDSQLTSSLVALFDWKYFQSCFNIHNLDGRLQRTNEIAVKIKPFHGQNLYIYINFANSESSLTGFLYFNIIKITVLTPLFRIAIMEDILIYLEQELKFFGNVKEVSDKDQAHVIFLF